MAPSVEAHSRSHSLLLLQKLLNQRDSTASPLTLVLDDLEQTAGPLLQEFVKRAKKGHTKIVFTSFATVKKPRDADVFVKGTCKTLQALQAELSSHCPRQKTLIIIDSLNPPASSEPRALPAFLSSIVTPHASVVAVYHADVAPVLPPSSRPYEPHPLSILLHLATAVLRVTSLSQAVARRRAQDKSLPEPEWGLREGREGVLIGLRESGRDTAGDGIVVEMEARRRSGRAVAEKFVLARDRADGAASAITLLAHHALFARPDDGDEADGEAAGRRDRMDTTFDLGLTEKQRRDREAIVLPYFDAKTDIGAGEGGRILYDMGREDDFDDEEDEV